MWRARGQKKSPPSYTLLSLYVYRYFPGCEPTAGTSRILGSCEPWLHYRIQESFQNNRKIGKHSNIPLCNRQRFTVPVLYSFCLLGPNTSFVGYNNLTSLFYTMLTFTPFYLKRRTCHTFSQEKNSTFPVISMAISHLPLRWKEMHLLFKYVKWKIFKAKYHEIHSFNREISLLGIRFVCDCKTASSSI